MSGMAAGRMVLWCPIGYSRSRTSGYIWLEGGAVQLVWEISNFVDSAGEWFAVCNV